MMSSGEINLNPSNANELQQNKVSSSCDPKQKQQTIPKSESMHRILTLNKTHLFIMKKQA
jgi:hypothetical protein